MTTTGFLRTTHNNSTWNTQYDTSSELDVTQKPKRFDNSLKVFIKNLPLEDDSTFSTLLDQFAACGTVQHSHFFVKSLADQKIQQGLVIFSTEEEADHATKLTGTVIGGKHIIVSRYRQFAQPTSKTVFLSNLPVETSEEKLWELFENTGTIKFIHINRPFNASSLRAEVHFKSEKSAVKARKLNGEFLGGNAISVCSSLENESQSQELSSKEYPVFVAGLPDDVQKEDLIKFFDGCGPIKRIKIKSFKEEGEGQAVVFFMDSEAAENAIACNGNEFSGFVLQITQREEGMLQYDLLNPVFVAGISLDTKDVDVFLKFQDCGLIHDIKFVQSKRGLLKKCVIQFKDSEGLEKALALTDLELNGHILVTGRTRDIWSGVHNVAKPKKRKVKQTNIMEQTSSLEEEASAEPISQETGVHKKKKKEKKLKLKRSE